MHALLARDSMCVVLCCRLEDNTQVCLPNISGQWGFTQCAALTLPARALLLGQWGLANVLCSTAGESSATGLVQIWRMCCVQLRARAVLMGQWGLVNVLCSTAGESSADGSVGIWQKWGDGRHSLPLHWRAWHWKDSGC